MSKIYTVQYDIQVLSETAVLNIQKFTTAAEQLVGLDAGIRKLAGSFNALNRALEKMSGKNIEIKVDTSAAEKKVTDLQTRLATLKASTNLGTFSINTGNGSGNGSGTKTGTSGNKAPKTNNVAPTNRLTGSSYNVFGKTLFDSGGLGVADMVKGFGVAYGITGIMTAVSSAVKSASEYDNLTKTTRNILATHDHLPAFNSRFEEMNRVMRNVGIETKFTAPEVADAGKFLAMAGFNISDIKNAIPNIANMALVGDTDLGETADVVTNIMTGYGINANKLSNVADIMTMTSTKANTTIMEMAEAFKYSASLLSNSGVAFEEATAAMGILGDAGIKGSQAGTSLRTIMVNLLKPTKKQAEVWNQIGVKRYDKNGKLRDMSDIFMDLNAKGVNTTQLASMFHKTALQGAISLVNNVDKWNEIIADNLLSENLAKRLADEKKNTISGLWAQLTSTFTEQGIKRFEALNDTIKGMLRGVTKYLKTEEFANTLRGIANLSIGVGTAVASAVRMWSNLFTTFRPIIQSWLVFQANVAPLLMGGRVVGAFLNFFRWLFTLSRTLIASAETANAISAAGAAGTATAGAAGTVVAGGLKSTILGAAGAALPYVGMALVAGGIASSMWSNYSNEVEEATERIRKWGGEVENLNGISIDKHASKMSNWLSVLNDQQLTANDRLKVYIGYLEKEYGLLGNPPEVHEKMKEIDPTGLNEDNSISRFDIFTNKSYDKLLAAVDGIKDEKTRQLYLERISHLGDTTSDKWFVNAPNVIASIFGGVGGVFETIGVNRAIKSFMYKDQIDNLLGEIYTVASASNNGKRRGERNESYINKLEYASNLAELKDIYESNFNSANKGAKQNRAVFVPFSEIGESTQDAFYKSTGFMKVSDSQFMSDNFTKGSAGEKIFSVLHDMHEQLGNKQTIDIKTLQDYLYYGHGIGLANSGMGVFGSEEWLKKNFGFDKNGNYLRQDDQKLPNLQKLIDLFRDLSKAADSMNGKFVPIVRSMFIDNPLNSSSLQWYKDLKGDGEEGESKKHSNGTYLMVNGKSVWHEWSDTFGKYVPAPKNDPANSVVDSHNGGGISGDGSTSGYESKYKSNSQAPKQIIVNIGNLMNVDKVDMSNEQKATAVNNLKRELAQTLIDVVHDFDVSFQES